MNRERVQMAIDFLKDVHDKKLQFNYGEWSNEYERKPYPCGTVACAAGWMALSTQFQKLGLTWYNGIPCIHVGPYLLYGQHAMAHLLGLSIDQAQTAFVYLDEKLDIPERQVTALHVAQYLEHLLIEDIKANLTLSDLKIEDLVELEVELENEFA